MTLPIMRKRNNLAPNAIEDKNAPQDKPENFYIYDNPATNEYIVRRGWIYDRESGIVFDGKIKSKHTVDFKLNEQCPICHVYGSMEFVNSTHVTSQAKGKNTYIAFFLCNACHRIYAVSYSDVPLSSFMYAKATNPVPCISVNATYTPYEPPLPKLNDIFNTVHFEKFRGAYRDLCLAKAYQIDGLVGMAYRRAIEYLVFDYLIRFENITVGELANKGLEKIITTNFQGDDISEFGQKAAWLGNDFTHYFNKHPEYSINDLATLFDYFLADVQKKIVLKKAKEIPRK